ncbi:response regulator transcription factor [Labrys sp. KNU-23]|uniref:response regulator transcription factor n=1 Tax=Labrys sp. KNU-23 TaxID=2789216 RepID=UPI0011EF0BED|nr:response regulator transcription factor [Labrys sp. KNU-23]QEN84978.1 response regulator transcription factor [Labrys sp. KNU-23]
MKPLSFSIEANPAMSPHASSLTPPNLDGLLLYRGGDGGRKPISRESLVRIVSICEPALLRDCLNHCLVEAGVAISVEGYATLDDWQPDINEGFAIVLLYCSKGIIIEIDHIISKIFNKSPQSRIVMMADLEDSSLIVRSIKLGARAFIGTNSSFDLVLAALQLVRAGGIYMPVEIPRQEIGAAVGDTHKSRLTSRQLEIVEYLRRGEPNAVIARELNIKNNTVKVHVRNVMRILGAKSRFDAVVKADLRAEL